ncbi:MAG: hypothetical protein EXR36_14840 [Betaproteobacteria bacterium]|nr:hypothetical protein [Betaproteobacteria bacterium]
MSFAVDLALAVFAALFAWRLGRTAQANQQLCVWLWASAVAALGGATMLGMLYRQIALLIVPGEAVEMLWRLSIALHLLSNGLLLCGVIIAYGVGRIRTAALAVTAVKLAALLVFLGYKQSFDLAVYDCALSALLLLVLCTYGAWTWKLPHAQWIVAGAVVWLFATLLHQGRVGPSQYFTPDDLFRAMEIAALLFFVRGGSDMRDDPSAQGFRELDWRLRTKDGAR